MAKAGSKDVASRMLGCEQHRVPSSDLDLDAGGLPYLWVVVQLDRVGADGGHELGHVGHQLLVLDLLNWDVFQCLLNLGLPLQLCGTESSKLG